MKIGILTPSFFCVNGELIYSGGGERYLIDLVSLLQGLNYEVDVFQLGAKEWVRWFEGFTVTGLKGGEEHDFNSVLNKEFNRLTKDYTGCIYFAHYMAFPEVHPKSIGISHGVWWDLLLTDGTPCYWRREKVWKEKLKASFELPIKTIAVDTNTINLARAFWPTIPAEKFEYIPNYVDLEKFKPSPEKKKGFTVLYPRRLCFERGFDLAVKVAEELYTQGFPIKFLFAGSGSLQEENYLKNLIKVKHKALVEWVSLKAEEMPSVYKQADLVILPTIGAEGTSLSCLEALASGVPVITTPIGGLVNIIRDGYNGLYCKPTTESLKAVILKAYKNRQLMKKLAENGLKTIQIFSKEIWQERWTEIIKEVF